MVTGRGFAIVQPPGILKNPVERLRQSSGHDKTIRQSRYDSIQTSNLAEKTNRRKEG